MGDVGVVLVMLVLALSLSLSLVQEKQTLAFLTEEKRISREVVLPFKKHWQRKQDKYTVSKGIFQIMVLQFC